MNTLADWQVAFFSFVEQGLIVKLGKVSSGWMCETLWYGHERKTYTSPTLIETMGAVVGAITAATLEGRDPRKVDEVEVTKAEHAAMMQDAIQRMKKVMDERKKLDPHDVKRFVDTDRYRPF